MGNRRLSQNVTRFNSQIFSINYRLQQVSDDWGGVARYIYLGVDAVAAGEIQTQATEWRTKLYPKYTDPRTRQLVDGLNGEVQRFMKKFRKLATPVLDFIAANSRANADDELAFNITLLRNRHKHSRRTEAIKAGCALFVEQGGIGLFRCRARKMDAEGRAHIPLKDGARQVEVAYNIVAKDGSNFNMNVDSWRTRERFSRALFYFHVGGEYSGYWIQLCARWYHPSYPHFAGPWGDIMKVVIP